MCSPPSLQTSPREADGEGSEHAEDCEHKDGCWREQHVVQRFGWILHSKALRDKTIPQANKEGEGSDAWHQCPESHRDAGDAFFAWEEEAREV